MKKNYVKIYAIILGVVWTMPSFGATFNDNFDTGISSEWDVITGQWSTYSNELISTEAGTEPPGYIPIISLKENSLHDISLDVDINYVAGAIILLRTSYSENGYNSINNGVVLVVAGYGATRPTLYWHMFQDGGVSPVIAQSGNIDGLLGGDIHLRVEVIGNTYSAYLYFQDNPWQDWATTPMTTFTTSSYPQFGADAEVGSLGLATRTTYSNSPMSFNNFSTTYTRIGYDAVPEPASVGLVLLSVGGLILRRLKRA